jgi:hypothetical protein
LVIKIHHAIIGLSLSGIFNRNLRPFVPPTPHVAEGISPYAPT